MISLSSLRRHWRYPFLLVLPAGLFLLPGCRKAEITTYLAPKDIEMSAVSPEADQDHNHAPDAPPEAPPVTYTASPEWKKLPSDRMNAAQFSCLTPQGEVMINITALGSMEGRENMLVGMWRGVFGLPELSEEDAKKALSPVEIAGEQGQMFEVMGDRDGQPLRIVTAFDHHGGKSWFFKMQGAPDAVETQKAAFVAFLKTVKF